MLALRARGLLMGNLGDLLAAELRFPASLPLYAAAARDYESFLKVDPGNTIAWNNLAANLMSLGLITEAAGRLQEAGCIRYRRGHIEVLGRQELEARTCECYRVVRDELRRLLHDPQYRQVESAIEA